MAEAYVALIFKSQEDFLYCNNRMQITFEHAAVNKEGYITVLVRTGTVRLPQGTLTVKTESGRNIRVQVFSGFRTP